MKRFALIVAVAATALCGCIDKGVGDSADADDSSYNLGVRAYRAKDYAKAFDHWSRAAAHGELNALNNLGFLLYNGYGVEKNVEEATDLWTTASFAGHSESQWHLGGAYEDGRGVEKNLSKAYAWYRCAIESATGRLERGEHAEEESKILKDARTSAAELEPTLTANELKLGKELAVEYVSRYARAAP
jgi:uncharacterized protein